MKNDGVWRRRRIFSVFGSSNIGSTGKGGDNVFKLHVSVMMRLLDRHASGIDIGPFGSMIRRDELIPAIQKKPISASSASIISPKFNSLMLL